MYDAVIVGGGPAGLNAALMLGRARRHVLLCDTSKPCNSASPAMHGFLTRDGFAPAELRRIAELQKYEGIDIREVAVTRASAKESGFAVTLDGSEDARARRLLLAFGVEDQLPPVEGLRELWGAVSSPVRIVMAGSCATSQSHRSATDPRQPSSRFCSRSGAEISSSARTVRPSSMRKPGRCSRLAGSR